MDAEGEIRRRIAEQGRITFAEFMEVALYWPVGGYYTSRHSVSPHDNFYTAARAHPAFAALLSLQLFQFWQLLERPCPFWVVEMGGADGLLARDILDYSAHLPDAFQDGLRYLCLDRSQAPGQPGGVQRITSEGVPLKGVVGCFLSNELVDAFPVHRVTMAGGKLQEVYVTVRDGALAEEMASRPPQALEETAWLSRDIALEEGQGTAEVNLAAGRWAEGVAGALERGSCPDHRLRRRQPRSCAPWQAPGAPCAATTGTPRSRIPTPASAARTSPPTWTSHPWPYAGPEAWPGVCGLRYPGAFPPRSWG